jgi:hypothetical protein
MSKCFWKQLPINESANAQGAFPNLSCLKYSGHAPFIDEDPTLLCFWSYTTRVGAGLCFNPVDTVLRLYFIILYYIRPFAALK